MCSLSRLPTSADIVPQVITALGERIHRDVCFNYLKYDTSAETGDPAGVLNYLDLAIWVDHPTMNIDWTGTILSMTIGILDSRLGGRTSRLYRLSWVLYRRRQNQGTNFTQLRFIH